jgi:hypothetical protein
MLKFIFISLWVFSHPVHVAFLSVEYSAKSGVLKVFVRIYCDDFIQDYRLLTGNNLEINFSGKKEFTKEIITKYLNDKVQLYADDKKLEGKLQDFDTSGGEMKVNFLYTTGIQPKLFTVKSQIMTNLYIDQSTFLLFKHNDFEEGIKLTQDKTEHTFKVK